MWNAPPNTIPEFQIRREHLRVLKDAIASEAPDTTEVREALAYLEAKAFRTGGFRSYRRWLDGEGNAHYHAAVAAIEKQFPEWPLLAAKLQFLDLVACGWVCTT